MITNEFIENISLQDEEWKQVGVEGHHYLVSSFGRIVSCPYTTTGCVSGKTSARLLTPVKDKRGFLNIRINKKVHKVHHLVASAFLKNECACRYVIHKDGNKENNCVSNLSWSESISKNKDINNLPSFSFGLDSLPEEEWRQIEGTLGEYLVSSFGRVKSIKRKPIVLAPKIDRNGYVHVAIFNGRTRRDVQVHRLVAEAFLGPSCGMEVDHIDGNPGNNSVTNLRWATHAENMNNPITTERLKKRVGPMKGRLGKRNARSKPIIAIDASGVRIEFEGIRDASRKGYSYHRIQYCLHHENAYYCGFKWRFLN